MTEMKRIKSEIASTVGSCTVVCDFFF